jgi:EAL domain-containing protein (putative c-di-GMP-specific phosphodiesterase class I)
MTTLQKHPGHVACLSLCSINLSGLSVSREGTYAFIEKTIRASGIDPGKFCFEFTETAEIKDNDEQLKQLGVDYAQGYYYSQPKPLSDVIKGTT